MSVTFVRSWLREGARLMSCSKLAANDAIEERDESRVADADWETPRSCPSPGTRATAADKIPSNAASPPTVDQSTIAPDSPMPVRSWSAEAERESDRERIAKNCASDERPPERLTDAALITPAMSWSMAGFRPIVCDIVASKAAIVERAGLTVIDASCSTAPRS